MTQPVAGSALKARAIPPELWGVRRVLAVVAHPDDESFGLGAVLSTLVDWGAAVDLVCFSRGEASTVGQSADLGAVRSKELSEAAEVLGLDQVWLEDLPDGDLQSHLGELRALVEAHAEAVDAVVVLEPSGVTGHPDHKAATLVAHELADERGISCVEWGISAPVAAALADELGAPLIGLEGPDVVELHVDRTRHHGAIARHQSQDPTNPLLGRRLDLQGDTERVRIRSAPFSSRLARFIDAAGPLVGAGTNVDERRQLLDLLVGFAAGHSWPGGVFHPDAGLAPGVHQLHRDPTGWSLNTIVVDAEDPGPAHTYGSWGAAATISGVQCATRFNRVDSEPSEALAWLLVARGSGYVFGAGEVWKITDATGRRSAFVQLLSSDTDRALPS